jgi:putative ABC transport system substrate-binding protein
MISALPSSARKVGRRLLAVLALAVCATPITLGAQAKDKIVRVGHLSGSGESASGDFVEAFKDGMRALGYAEGRNLRLEARYAEGRIERLPALAEELVRGAPDVLLVATTPANLAAKAATTTIPIVMVLVADPVGAGIVRSLPRPGGNITGVTNIVAELAGKRFEILKELVPGARRFAVLVNPESQNAPLQMQNAREAALKLGIELSPVLEVRDGADLEKAFGAAARARVAGAIRMIDPLVFMLRRETVALAARHRLPVIYPTGDDVEAGGLVAYGANVTEQYRQAARFVDRILRGAKPADLPVEQPTHFELVINARTAKALGLAISPALRARADRIVE